MAGAYDMEYAVMKKAIALLCIVLLLTSTISFAQTTSDPAAVEREMTGLFRSIGKFFVALGKLFSGKKAGKVLSTAGDVMEGSANQAFDGKYAPKKDDEEKDDKVNEKKRTSVQPVKEGKWPITFINRSDFPISVNISGFTSSLSPVSTDHSYFPESSQATDRWNNDVFRTPLDYELEYDVQKVRYVLENFGRTIYFLNRDEEDGEYAKKPESNAPVNTFEIAENGMEKQSPEILADIPTPDFDQNAPGFDTIPEAKTAVNPQTDYTNHVPLGDPVRIANNVPQQSHDPLPLISNFRKGMYYVQIGSYTNENTVYTEIAKIDNSLPVAVMRATVKINGINKEVHRVLIGPLDYENSLLLLQQFRVNYHDAFVWHGR